MLSVVEGDQQATIWRASALGLWCARLALVAVTVGAIVTFGFAVGTESAGNGILCVFLLLVAAGLWRCGLYPRVVLTPTELTIQNPLRTHRVPLSQIVAAAGDWSGVVVTTAGGREVAAWAIQKSNLAKWRNRPTRADKAADAIMRSVHGLP